MKTESVPFLRWAGGKSWFLPIWKRLVNSIEFNRYFEPFLGSGTMFFSLPGNHTAILSDMNKPLIETYRNVMESPKAVFDELQKFSNTKTDYYRIRSQKFRLGERIAAQFIYLNQTSFNGLYRVNAKGEYNVPYGHRTNWTYRFERLKAASDTLKRQHSELLCGDFEDAIINVRQGDLVFLDPPYAVSERGKDNLFVEYNEKIFSLGDQHRLRECIDFIERRKAFYVLTNAGHPTIERIFETEDRKLDLYRHSLIGGKPSARKLVKEIAITNIPEGKQK